MVAGVCRAANPGRFVYQTNQGREADGRRIANIVQFTRDCHTGV